MMEPILPAGHLTALDSTACKSPWTAAQLVSIHNIPQKTITTVGILHMNLFAFPGEDFKVEVREAPQGVAPPHEGHRVTKPSSDHASKVCSCLSCCLLQMTGYSSRVVLFSDAEVCWPVECWAADSLPSFSAE